MGYQRVRVRLKSGRGISDALAFNARELELPDGAPAISVADIAVIELSSPSRTG
jgi:hypothetical protein